MRQLSGFLLFFVAAVFGQEQSVIVVDPVSERIVEGDPAIVFGQPTGVDGIETDPLVRLEGNPPFSLGAPPEVEILWPTNEMEYLVSDAVVPLDIRVRLRDVDGDLRELVVKVDGTELRTNAVEGEMVVPWPQPADGEHQLQATVTDSGGLTDSETITFRIRTLPFPGAVEARREGNGVVILYTGGTLQGSTDLRTWREMHRGGGEFRPGAVEKEQFFRVAF